MTDIKGELSFPNIGFLFGYDSKGQLKLITYTQPQLSTAPRAGVLWWPPLRFLLRGAMAAATYRPTSFSSSYTGRRPSDVL